jgi:hypothetical protein
MLRIRRDGWHFTHVRGLYLGYPLKRPLSFAEILVDNDLTRAHQRDCLYRQYGRLDGRHGVSLAIQGLLEIRPYDSPAPSDFPLDSSCSGERRVR